jgi:hypothetical protein
MYLTSIDDPVKRLIFYFFGGSLAEVVPVTLLQVLKIDPVDEWFG